MGSVRIYVATSADGFIADRDGGVDWLAAFDPRAYGYDRFWAGIGAVVMGRRTFQHVQTFADDWPYAGRRSFVLASQPVGALPSKEVTIVRAGIAEALQSARDATDKDVWIVGGAVTMRGALEQRLVDVVEIFFVPVLLGSGIPLLGAMKSRVDLAYKSIETFPDGVVRLVYEPKNRKRR
jgi:dihydrofolate reductase